MRFDLEKQYYEHKEWLKTAHKGKDYRGTNFAYSVMEDIDFSGTDLTNASFKGAKLIRCNFADAVIDGCDFTDVIFIND